MAETGHGDAGQIITDAGALHDGAEQDEEEDEGRGNRQRNAEHAFGRRVEMTDNALGRVAAMGDQFRHVRPEIGIGHEDDGNRRQHGADRAARGFQKRDDGDSAHEEVGRRLGARAHDHLVEVDIEI